MVKSISNVFHTVAAEVFDLFGTSKEFLIFKEVIAEIQFFLFCVVDTVMI